MVVRFFGRSVKHGLTVELLYNAILIIHKYKTDNTKVTEIAMEFYEEMKHLKNKLIETFIINFASITLLVNKCI